MTTYVISDVHLGAVSEANVTSFLAFLDRIHSGEVRAKCLILLGDIFDEWIYDFSMTTDEVERTRKKFVTMADLVIARLSLCEKAGVKILYLVGNHDQYITETLPELSRWIVPERLSFALDSRKVLLMHGHRLDAFNTNTFLPDLPETGHGRFPIGYYIARAYKSGCSDANQIKTRLVGYLLRHLDESGIGAIIDAFIGNHPHTSIITSIFSFLGCPPSKIVPIDSCASIESVSIKRLVEIYAEVLQKEQIAMGQFHEMIEASYGNLDRMVAHFCSDYQIVILGHTHIKENRVLSTIEGKLELFVTSSWEKDGSITGIQIGEKPTFYKISASEVKASLDRDVANHLTPEEKFASNIEKGKITLPCEFCKGGTLLKFVTNVNAGGHRTYIVCSGCGFVHCPGSREATSRASKLSAVLTFREEAVRKIDSDFGLLACYLSSLDM